MTTSQTPSDSAEALPPAAQTTTSVWFSGELLELLNSTFFFLLEGELSGLSHTELQSGVFEERSWQ